MNIFNYDHVSVTNITMIVIMSNTPTFNTPTEKKEKEKWWDLYTHSKGT